jgi:hypothetical protein
VSAVAIGFAAMCVEFGCGVHFRFP